MMHTFFRTFVLTALLSAPALGIAQITVNSVDEAVANLREANARLSYLLSNEVDDNDIPLILTLSDTLEASLTKLASESTSTGQGKVLQQLIGDVDDMRFFSEQHKHTEALQRGKRYLENSTRLLN